MKKFPDWLDAPTSLLSIDGYCGLLSIWAILKYFGKRTNTDRLVKSARYTKRNGVFGIGAAVSFVAHGLSVSFFGDKDPEPLRTETQLFRLAQRSGIQKENAISLPALLRQVSEKKVALVLYDKPSGEAHYSPLLGLNKGILLLPFETERAYSMRAFNKAWKKEGILMQSLLISMPDKRADSH